MTELCKNSSRKVIFTSAQTSKTDIPYVLVVCIKQKFENQLGYQRELQKMSQASIQNKIFDNKLHKKLNMFSLSKRQLGETA